jgi:homoserine O-succinyltransferase/O-acetyltransferase
LRINRDVRARVRGSNAEDDITIGLVNIMPAMAMRRTERQFTFLLNLASPRHKIHLKFFTILDLYPENIATFHLDHDYEDIAVLWNSKLDGLIITGTEPQAASMVDEACWPMLAKLVDWTSENTISTIWSCFAAHAAVFRMDGIRRQPFAAKLSGVFECMKVAEHKIVATAPARWLVPHSRYNTLNEEELCESGYRVLSRSPRVGADMFVKQFENSQFVFFQGHPEYDADTLYGEYCRDIKRYLNGHRTTYPNKPEGYLDGDTIAAFAELQVKAHLPAKLTHLADLNGLAIETLKHPWQEPARQLYAGWLSSIRTQRNKTHEHSYIPYIQQTGE